MKNLTNNHRPSKTKQISITLMQCDPTLFDIPDQVINNYAPIIIKIITKEDISDRSNLLFPGINLKSSLSHFESDNILYLIISTEILFVLGYIYLKTTDVNQASFYTHIFPNERCKGFATAAVKILLEKLNTENPRRIEIEAGIKQYYFGKVLLKNGFVPIVGAASQFGPDKIIYSRY